MVDSRNHVRSGRTTQLLKEVIHRLNTRIVGNPHSIDLTMTEAQISTVRSICCEFFAKKGEREHVDISKLFATIELIIKKYGCRRPYEDNELALPCKFDYHTGVRVYLFYGHNLEISLMKENVNDTKTYYYYVVISFPEEIHLYEVVEIPNDWVPKFTSPNHVKTNDEVNIRSIATTLSKVFDTFCLEFVVKNKFRRREFSIRAIQPVFSTPEKLASTTKRKRNTRSKTPSDINSKQLKKRSLQPPLKMYMRVTTSRDSMMNILEFMVEPDPIYSRLNTLYKAMTEKPNEASRLFAVIHGTLLSLYACKISCEIEHWPGGSEYNNNVYDLLYSDSKIDETEPIHEQYVGWYAFKLCLLNNGNEFYICIRFSGNTAQKCCKRIVKSLVPTFDAADLNKENEKIANLSLFLSAIIEHFMKKVIGGSYHSANPSFISSSQDSEDE